MESAGPWSPPLSNNRVSVKSAAGNVGQWSRGLTSPPDEELSSPADMTLRHMFSMIQNLLMESQVNIAIHVVNEITADATLSSLLDMQLASAGELSHRFVDLFKMERDSLASMLDRMGDSLEGVKLEAGDNLLAKLETTAQQASFATMGLQSSKSESPAPRAGGAPVLVRSQTISRLDDKNSRMSVKAPGMNKPARNTIGGGNASRYSILYSGSGKPQKSEGPPETRRASTVEAGGLSAGTRRTSNVVADSVPKRSSLLVVSPTQAPANARRGSRDMTERPGELSNRPHPRVSLTQALGLDTMMLNKVNPEKVKSTSSASTTASVPVSKEKNGKGSGTESPPRKREDTVKSDAGHTPPGAVVGAAPAFLQSQNIELTESDFGESSSSESMMIDDEVRISPVEAISQSVQDFSETEPLGWPENRAKSPVPPTSPSPVECQRSSSGEVCADRCRPQSAPPIKPISDKGDVMSFDPLLFSGARLGSVDAPRPAHGRFTYTGASGLQSMASLHDSPTSPKRSSSWPSLPRPEGLPVLQASAMEDELLDVVASSPCEETESMSPTDSNNNPSDSIMENIEVSKSPAPPNDTEKFTARRTRFTLPSGEVSTVRGSIEYMATKLPADEEKCESDSESSIEEIHEPHPYYHSSSRNSEDVVLHRKSVMSMGSHITVNAKPSVKEGTVQGTQKQPSDHPMFKMKQKTMSATKYFMTTETLEEDQAAHLGTPTHRFIIHPSSLFRMSWDCCSLVIILLESLVLPMGLCFNMYPDDWIMWISTIFFTPDLILNFFTGYYCNGLLIMRHHLIARRYGTGWFAIDFCSTVPWEVIFSRQQGNASFMLKFAKIGKLMRVLRLLRIFKLKTLLQRVEDMFSSYIVLFTLSIAKTVGVYVIFCHWIACVWGAIGAYDGDAIPYERLLRCEPDGPCENGLGVNDSPWRRRYGLTNDRSIDQYLIALQFATALLTGAELQLMPGRAMERIFVTAMTIVSFLVCSMIISQIVVIMEKINQDNSQYLEHTRMMRDFMVSRGMPIKLQTKVKRYLEYQFKSRKVVHQNHEVIQQLSPYLRIEIQEHMNRVILEHHPFFAGMEQSVLSQVCTLAKSELYAPGDIVLRCGQLSSLILFIVRGQLMINDAREGFDICLRAPAWIGDRGLFVTCELRHTVTCSAHSEILTIAQQDLIDLVSLFPSAEAYIKEYCKRVIVHDPGVIFCDFCHQAGHDIDSCEELTDAVVERQRSSADAPARTLKPANFHNPAATFKQTLSSLKHFVSKTTAAHVDAVSAQHALESRQSRTRREGTSKSRNSEGVLSKTLSMGIEHGRNGRRDTVAEVCDAWGDD